MSSDIRRMIFNTRERATSSDVNDATALHHRALLESTSAVASGDVREGGVLRGLNVSIVAATLNVNVNAGLALKQETAPSSLDSVMEWVELRTTEVVDLSSLVDGINPRWVVIEIAPNDGVESNLARDVFDPSTGTFTPGNLDKIRGSAPTITARAGTAAASPALPAGIADVIPLAYIFLGAAAAIIVADDIIHCRPMLRASGRRNTLLASEVLEIRGGGIEVNALSLTYRPRECVGVFEDHHLPFHVPGGFAAILSATMFDGGSLPGADDVVYFYALPVDLLYPAGYDGTLAAREFLPQGDSAAGAVSRFASGGVIEGVAGAFIVASAQAPAIDAKGEPTIGGNFSITDTVFGGASTPGRSNAIYLGATWFDQSDNELEPQEVRGSEIIFTGLESINLNFFADLPQVNPGISFSAWSSRNGVAGEDLEFPVTAEKVFGVVHTDWLSGGDMTFEFRDARSQGVTTGPSAYAIEREDPLQGTGGSSQEDDPITLYPLSSSGNIQLRIGNQTGTTGAGIELKAYEDAILASR